MEKFSDTFKSRWFWYSILTVVGWAGWPILLKIGSIEIPERHVLFLQTTGMVPVALLLLLRGSLRGPQNRVGVVYSLLNGVITGVGILCLLVAYRSGGNTSVVAVTTSLYPLITFVLAVPLLREKITRTQVLGVILATISITIFAL
jgi:uncharacterized membrane protein